MREEYSFGPFKFDAADRLLSRDGVVQRLGPKAAHLLLFLLRHHGHVVTKDECLREVWGEAFVADGSLTFQIHLLRQALRDGTTSYVEAVPRRGYRLVAPVRSTTEEDAQPVLVPTPAAGPRGRRSIVLLSIAAVAVILLVARTLQGTSGVSIPRVVNTRQLTHDRRVKDDLTPLLFDGQRVYFVDSSTMTQRVVDGRGGDPIPVKGTSADNRIVGLSPDRTSFLMTVVEHGRWRLWVAPTNGQQSYALGSLTNASATWSPDQQRLVAVVEDDVLILDRQGVTLKDLGRFGRSAGCPRWSPDGRALRFVVTSPKDISDSALWEIGIDGSNPHPLFPAWAGSYSQGCGAWSQDGAYFVFDAVNRHDGWNVGSPPPQPRHDLWLLRRGETRPVQLTSGPTSFSAPVPSDDGATVFAIGVNEEAELLRFDRALGAFTPYLNGLSARWINFSRDASRITYVRHPDGTLWTANVDGSDKRQLTFAPFEADTPAVSPDERWIAFRGRSMGALHTKVYLLPAAGGTPMPITSDDVEQGVPTWAPDSRRLAFGDVPPRWEMPVGSEVLHIYDLLTRSVATVPNSKLLWTPRWSPDGRFLAALSIHGQRLMIGDLSTGRWRATDDVHVEEPVWSRDGHYIYHTTEGGPKVLARVRVSDGQIERFTKPAEFAATVPAWLWFGLSSDDQPIVLARSGPTEIYSLKLEWR